MGRSAVTGTAAPVSFRPTSDLSLPGLTTPRHQCPVRQSPPAAVLERNMAAPPKRTSIAVPPPAAPVAAPVAEPDAFSIRVMRLVSPSLIATPSPLGMLEQSAFGAVADAEGTADPASAAASSSAASPAATALAALSSSLAAASSFGTVYLGEHFRSYVTVLNTTAATFRGASVKIELQTAAARVSLMDSCSISSAGGIGSETSVYAAAQSRDFIVQHSVVETGVHCLVVTIAFRDDAKGGAAKTMQKFFKFNVVAAIAIKSQVYPVEELLFAEARVTNLTARPIFLDSVRFNAFDSFVVDDVGAEAPPAPPPLSVAALCADAAGSDTASVAASSASLSSSYSCAAPTDAALSAVTSALSLFSHATAARVLKPNETRAFLFRIRMMEPASPENQVRLASSTTRWKSHQQFSLII